MEAVLVLLNFVLTIAVGWLYVDRYFRKEEKPVQVIPPTTVVPLKKETNDIETKEDDGIDLLNEEYRVPIMPGIKIKFEGQDDSQAAKLNINPIKLNG